MHELYKYKRRNTLWVFTVVCVIVIIFFSGCESKKKETPKIEGYWKGIISVIGDQYPIGIRFVIDNDASGYIDIPKQGARGVKLEKVKYLFPSISFELPSEPNRIFFNGTYKENGITGTFKQGTVQGSFTLHRSETGDGEEKYYSNEEIILETTRGNIVGELVVPVKSGTFPVIVIVPDGGAVDMDGNTIFIKEGHNCLKILAHSLARMNIASLRYDKRGIGKSMEAFTDLSEIRFDHHVEDVAGWMALLRNDPRFFSIGVIGHGEGSLIGMIAARKGKSDFFISIAGSGRPADEVMLDQFKYAPDPLIYKESQRIINEIKAGRTVTDIREDLRKYFMPVMQPFLMSLFKYDPAQEITRLTIPVLLVHGSTDLKIRVEEGKKLKDAKPDAFFIVIPGMNHVLKPAPPEPGENLKTYTDPDLPVSEKLITEVTRFIYDSVLKLTSKSGEE